MQKRREERMLCGPFDSKFEKIYIVTKKPATILFCGSQVGGK
jgi:hypothetical protein